MRSVLSRARAGGARPVDAASAAAFRVAFGLLAAVAALRPLVNGWVGPLYLDPAHHFTYPGFGWVAPWPGIGVHLHLVALAVLGIAVAVGYRYRLALGLWLAGFVYLELIDRAFYLNHHYWMAVAAATMLLLPLGDVHSLDARRRGGMPPLRVPAATVWTLRGLVGMVYVFAGIAKLNPDWLLRGQPLAIWLPQDAGLPLIGPLLDQHATALVVSWTVVAFELAAVPLLLWRRTRAVAYVVVVAFHAGTALILPEIGLFPLIMAGGALVFLAPDWPRRTAMARAWRWAPALVGAIALVQLVLPFRHLLYPGDVRWTEEGYRYSWRVMLTEKVGHAEFEVTDPADGRTWTVRPREYLTPVQERAMSVQPDMVRDTARMIRDDLARHGHPGVAVRAHVMVSMHGRPARPLIDPRVDLAHEGGGLGAKRWILHDF